ncbi:aminopeptidase N [Corynebacterium breve]|uniref:Aminopeptidase N n=1 Tax=Corynebacterium breve TaxID=3049799 RepID=A0ABY8VDL6_9CORY|nr:aminopeptidase N [Corynebacterium breve]WIM67202.1 aminopeptidase N [Corynebacterium breve]
MTKSLTRSHADLRAQLISNVHYDIALDITGTREFTSRTTVTFHAQPGEVSIDLAAPQWEATLDDEPLPHLNFAVSEGEHRLVVNAVIPYSKTGEGLHRFVDPADQKEYLYSQFEPADAHRVFACFDQPDIKATYSIAVTAPEKYTVILNEPVTVSACADGKQHTCEIDYPLSTYLIAFIAGEYASVHEVFTETVTDIPLGLYARASVIEHLDAKRLFRETKEGFTYFHENFGLPYPFTKYDQIFCPEFNMGAMEHVGAVTIRDEYVFTSETTPYMYERRNETILHEMAHMWFGNLVTMNWWDDLWLNESFATWSAAIAQAEATDYRDAWVTFANVEKAWAYQQDQLPSTHPVATDAPDVATAEQNFDGITYAKGASVLKQLQAYVGRDAFFAGVREHFANHSFANASFNDLLGALEKSSGRDLSDWANQWLRTTGISRLTPEITPSSFAVVQDSAVMRTHRIGIGLYSLVDGQVTRTHFVEVDITDERTEVPQLAGIEHDLALVNDDDLTYCLMGIAPEQQAFLLENLGRIAAPMPRTLCWSALWQQVRGGELAAREFVRLVARFASQETLPSVLERLVAQATQAVKNFVAPDWQEEGFNLLNRAFRGSEPAAIFDRALARIPLDDDSVAYFTAALETSKNQELRWLMITALIARGDLDLNALDTEDDTSATGEQARLRARAVVDKHWAFEQIVSGEPSNVDTRYLMEGFNFTDRDLEQFTDKYFELAERLWTTLSSEMAQRTLAGIYPRWAVNEDALAQADALLARDLPAGLRRVISEEQDKVARSLRNRTVDAES